MLRPVSSPSSSDSSFSDSQPSQSSVLTTSRGGISRIADIISTPTRIQYRLTWEPPKKPHHPLLVPLVAWCQSTVAGINQVFAEGVALLPSESIGVERFVRKTEEYITTLYNFVRDFLEMLERLAKIVEPSDLNTYLAGAKKELQYLHDIKWTTALFYIGKINPAQQDAIKNHMLELDILIESILDNGFIAYQPTV